MSSYATLVDFNAYLPGSTSNATHAQLCLDTASRWIDGATEQDKFSLDTVATARTFEAKNRYYIEVDDIGDTTGLIIKTDAAGDGTFETTWQSTDYEVLPVNAPSEGPEPAPWTSIRAVGTQVFPLPYAGLLARRDRVQVTAKWGWPAVPVAIQHACLMQAARLFSRTKSPDGVAGFGDSVALRVSNQIDPDVADLIQPYRRYAAVHFA